MKPTLFTRRRIEVKRRTVDGIEPYDIDNAYPQRVTDIVNNSSTGKACVNLLAKFIQGQGFKDLSVFQIKVNKKQTADKFLRSVAQQWAKHGDTAVHVNYNLLGEAVSYTPVPVSFLRFPDHENKEHLGHIAFHTDWDNRKGKRFDKKDILWFHPFDSRPEVILSQIEEAGTIENYRGQILWHAWEEGEYQLAPCDPVLEDMQTEGHAKLFKYRNITTNYMASHLLIVDKHENAGIENEVQLGENDIHAGRLEARRIKETSRQEQAFIQSLEDFQGADDAMKIGIIEKDHPDQTFELKKVDIQDVEDLYQFTEESVRDNIIRCSGAPPVLISVHVQGKLGTSKEIKDAVDFYNGVTGPDRLLIEELFIRLFSIWHERKDVQSFEIIPIKYQTSAIPAELFKDMSQNERRALIDLPEVEEKGDQKRLIERMGATSVQATIAILTDATLTPDQKRGVLLTFGFTEDEVNQMLPE